ASHTALLFVSSYPLRLSHPSLYVFSLITPLPPRSTLFPYTTLFRSSFERWRAACERQTGNMPPSILADFYLKGGIGQARFGRFLDRKSTRLNSSHGSISYAVFCLKKKIKLQSKNRQQIHDIIHDNSI